MSHLIVVIFFQSEYVVKTQFILHLHTFDLCIEHSLKTQVGRWVDRQMSG